MQSGGKRICEGKQGRRSLALYMGPGDNLGTSPRQNPAGSHADCRQWSGCDVHAVDTVDIERQREGFRHSRHQENLAGLRSLCRFLLRGHWGCGNQHDRQHYQPSRKPKSASHLPTSILYIGSNRGDL